MKSGGLGSFYIYKMRFVLSIITINYHTLINLQFSVFVAENMNMNGLFV